MGFLRRFLLAMRSHKVWAWLGLLVYACAVTFPHQQVQNVVGQWAVQISLKRLYQISATLALIEGAVLTFFLLRGLRGQTDRRWLLAFWLLSFALMVGTWRLFTANNTELIHYPQYFPEGMALLALTLSPAESMAWIALFGGLDEAFQYTFLVQGRPLPYDFNDVYMDLVGGAAGIIFAMAVLGCRPRMPAEGWARRILTRPVIIVVLGIVAVGIALWASGKMLLYEAPGSPSHWFSLSRLKTPSFWYFSPGILGPHHFHELAPTEGPVLILATIALYGMLDRRLKILAEPDA
jgi:hypothetical protein